MNSNFTFWSEKGYDMKAIFGRMDSLSVGEALSQLAFGKSCHQPAPFSHWSLVHSAENRCLRFIKTALTKSIYSHLGIIELVILIEGDDMLTIYPPKNREQLEMITLDQLVPEKHLVRNVKAAIDFSLISSLVKEKHRIRWTTLRAIEKLFMQAMLTFAAVNLKKMVNWLWKTPKWSELESGRGLSRRKY